MSDENSGFAALEEGDRFLFKKKFFPGIMEDELVEVSPSSGYLKFARAGWMSSCDLSHYELLEVLKPIPDAEDMCPNCVTPWKCNGPHHARLCRGAPAGSPQLDEYLRSIGL
jgi:hypothetical protein